MSAGKHNFTIEQGTTLRKKFRWTAAGEPVDLTGAVCRMQIRKSKSTTSVLIADWTDYLTLDAPDGSVLLEVPGDVTYAYVFDTGLYSLRVDRPGEGKRLIEGLVTNSRETTANA